MQISIAFHLLGIILWLGGLMIVTRLLAFGDDKPSPRVVTRVFFGYVIPGAVIAALTGTVQLLWRGIGFYMSQPWFHTKLTAVALLVGVTVGTGLEIARYRTDGKVKSGLVNAYHGVTGLILIGVLLLTELNIH